MTSVREKYHTNLLDRSTRAFEDHQIREHDVGRWLIQRRSIAWEQFYWTEVVVLRGGYLLVNGDIEPVLFGVYTDSRDPEQTLRWMGDDTDITGYVASKALRTGRELIMVRDNDVLIEDLRVLLGEYKGDQRRAIGAAIRRVRDGEPWERIAWDLGVDGIESESLVDVGLVVAPRVYFAHAALARLCRLLDARAATQAGGSHD